MNTLRVIEFPLSVSSADILHILRNESYPFFLDSVINVNDMGRYSYFGFDPFCWVYSKGKDVVVNGKAGKLTNYKNPFSALKDILNAFKMERCDKTFPFLAGGVGYFGYDLYSFIEDIEQIALDDLGLPDLFFCFYDRVFVLDNMTSKLYLSFADFDYGGTPFADIIDIDNDISDWVSGSYLKYKLSCAASFPENAVILGELFSNFTKERYVETVAKALEYIAAGDIYQVNLSQRFAEKTLSSDLEIYNLLRRNNPASFCAYLPYDNFAVLSTSPERFLKVSGRKVETKPIKGTRPRGKTAEVDGLMKNELYCSEKDNAELVMIVDLERNDLGKVCTYGSVKVPVLKTVESYASVHHLVATVVGCLHEGRDCIDLMRACFPGGSITGAPKVRSMEIIEELEPTKRSVYTGSIGYICFDGDLDLNIVIRTVIKKGDMLYLHVGGGIVADSDPYAEYQETLDKGKAIIRALGSNLDDY